LSKKETKKDTGNDEPPLPEAMIKLQYYC